MKIDVRVVDINDQLVQDPSRTPYAMIKREVAEGHLRTAALTPGATDHFHILQGAMDKEHTWSLDKRGSHVAVPMSPYVVDSAAESLMKFGLQFGTMAALDGPAGHRMIIVMSTIYGRPDNKPGYCVYVGVTIKRET